MPVHPFGPLRGRVETIVVSGDSLRNNLLGDPVERQVAVYLPPGYDENEARDYPLFVDIVGFTGSGLRHVGWSPFEESVPQRLERLVAEGKMGPVVAAFPDCFTSLGGNQYINSAALGNWADFLIAEMTPRLEAGYRLRRGREHRAIFGKSSGGYGAIAHGMRYADAWGAIGCHSGDMAFEWCYLPEMPATLDALAKHGGTAATFMEHLRGQRKAERDEMHVLMMLAMAATYDPDPEAPYGIRLPVDLSTCALREERWRAWLAHDPVRMVEEARVQENLRRLRGLYIDCGSRDQYRLHYGARQLVARLQALGITHHYEEFDDTHSGIDYRMDTSLPWLYRAVGEGA